MMSPKLLTLAVTAALVGSLPVAVAQVAPNTKHIVLDNVAPVAGQNQVGGHAAIPLTGTAQVDAQGNIVVTCQTGTHGGAGTCSNIGGGSTTITSFPSINNFPATHTVNTTALAAAGLPWATTGADTCYGKSVTRTDWTGTGNGPAAPASAWNNVHATSGPYSLTTLYNDVGAGNSAKFEFVLRCYSSAAVTISGADLAVGVREAKSVVTLSPPAGSTPAGNCQAYKDSLGQIGDGGARDHFEAYNAENRGFTRQEMTFQAKTGRILGEASSVGTVNTALPGPQAATQYHALTFSLPAAGGTNSGKFSLQTQTGVGAATPVIITISPCPGDFRPKDDTAGAEHYTTSICRTDRGQASMTVRGATPGAPGAGATWCNVPVGQTMYMNITKRNLYLPPGSSIPNSSCPASAECGVGAQINQ